MSVPAGATRIPCECGEESHMVMLAERDGGYPPTVELSFEYQGRVRDRLRDIWRLFTGQQIALAQVTSGIDPVANAETLVAAVAEAARAGAEMLFTPEMSGLLDRDRARAAQVLRHEADDVGPGG